MSVRIRHQSKMSRRGTLRAVVALAGVPLLLRFSEKGALAAGQGFAVVVHPGNPSASFSRDFLEDAFLKRTTEFPGGEGIKPVDQSATSAVRELFTRRVLRRSVAAVKSYWQQRIFSGRGSPPPELASDALVLEYVLAHEGAIGYIADGVDPRGAKVVPVR